MQKAVIVSYARTSIGAYLGGLKSVSVQDLATIASKEAVETLTSSCIVQTKSMQSIPPRRTNTLSPIWTIPLKTSP